MSPIKLDSPASSPQGELSSQEETGKPVLDVATLLKTMDFAATKHENQRRKNKHATPYINHPLGVANILSTYGVTHLATLQAAVLHDTVEDTDTDIEEIAREFGDEVARIVEECTDPPDMCARARKDLQVATAAKKSKEAQQVKLGDKLHNLRSILEDPPVGWTAKRCQDYFRWAKNVTDICLPSLPLIQIPLDEIYLKRHFVLDGKAYKCHPDLGDKTGKISDEEQRRIKSLIEREKREKKRGWESPIYT
ncbi:hypothetical protein HD553DRAFT_269266 [Filobasidium floriforme]|uniref:uncharacterized protein n=1 Tax=Filobasidium floriforme TaxID=5210 RepID=UPI001E8D7830|nr:uncharacterized protein HD553DRAFT_269266 [Filobasidium floriforme]KAH8087947.1 hypothetical protein HD553DRAFT_269266 [Filobasidium floriforme]